MKGNVRLQCKIVCQKLLLGPLLKGARWGGLVISRLSTMRWTDQQSESAADSCLHLWDLTCRSLLKSSWLTSQGRRRSSWDNT